MSGLDGLRGVTPSGDDKGKMRMPVDSLPDKLNCVFEGANKSCVRELKNYNDKDQLVEKFTFWRTTGTSIYHEITEYDANGRKIKETWDKGGENGSLDGYVDGICYYEYTSSSNESFVARSDIDADGTIDEISYQTENEDGSLTIAYDTDADGVIDDIEYIDYSSDRRGFRKRVDCGADGTIDQTTYSGLYHNDDDIVDDTIDN